MRGMRWRVRTVGIAAALQMMVGCGSNGGGDVGGSVGPGTTGGAAPGGSAPGPSSSGGGGSCNGLVASGPMITDQKSTALPALNGGPLTDGMYTLAKYEWFDNQSTLHQRRIVIQISNGGRDIQYLWQRDQDPDQRMSATVFTSGSGITLRASCPAGTDIEWDKYGVEGNQLVLFSTRDTKAATLVRQ